MWLKGRLSGQLSPLQLLRALFNVTLGVAEWQDVPVDETPEVVLSEGRNGVFESPARYMSSSRLRDRRVLDIAAPIVGDFGPVPAVLVRGLARRLLTSGRPCATRGRTSVRPRSPP